MTQYYFVSTSLPELQVGYPSELTFSDMVNLMEVNLKTDDLLLTQVVRRYYDIQNIRSLMMEEEIDPRGNFNAKELEDAIATSTGLPEYVYDYLEQYDGTENRLRHFSSLISAYFKEEIQRATGFLEQYLTFEKEWRLVLTGFRAKQLGRNVAEELQFEDPDDDVVAQILAQKDAKYYEPPTQYEDLKVLFEQHKSDPLDLYQALCEYRFEKLNSWIEVEAFSIDRILGYLAQLVIVEKWMELDKKKGLDIVDQIVKEAS